MKMETGGEKKLLPVRENSLRVEVWQPVIKRAYSSIFTAVLHTYSSTQNIFGKVGLSLHWDSFVNGLYAIKQIDYAGIRGMT